MQGLKSIKLDVMLGMSQLYKSHHELYIVSSYSLCSVLLYADCWISFSSRLSFLLAYSEERYHGLLQLFAFMPNDKYFSEEII